jgi:ABC transport system ATP-binding/permease protein
LPLPPAAALSHRTDGIFPPPTSAVCGSSGDGTVSFAEGKFTDYLQARKDEQAELRRASQKTKKSNSPAPGVAPAPAEPTARKLSYNERREYQNLEKQIVKAEARHAELSGRLEAEADTAGYTLLAEWTDELAALDKAVEVKSERWMELAERAELLG